jgi:epoxyqueuosine reductase
MSATPDYAALARRIKSWGKELGFAAVGIGGTGLAADEAHLLNWLAAGRHGEMDYMARHGTRRSRPAELVPGTLRVISLRMDYWPPQTRSAESVLADATLAFRLALCARPRLSQAAAPAPAALADRISAEIGPFGYRAFTDSAPVLEKALAQQAGLGWIGKHTNLIDKDSGSWFFLGELYTDLPLPLDTVATNHCGTCHACIDACPTGAIVAPYELDARLCISYLTIELRGSIPEPLRPLIGNRIYGCDDCQLVCPWNRFATHSDEAAFAPRHALDGAALAELFAWDEPEFLERTAGSAIRRIGHACWLRNIAVALGNAPTTPEIVAALEKRRDHPSELVREHAGWALARHGI